MGASLDAVRRGLGPLDHRQLIQALLNGSPDWDGSAKGGA
jgi:hypothetical protein